MLYHFAFVLDEWRLGINATIYRALLRYTINNQEKKLHVKLVQGLFIFNYLVQSLSNESFAIFYNNFYLEMA